MHCRIRDMHVKYRLNQDKHVKYHCYVAGACYIITSTLSTTHCLVMQLVYWETIIKYVIVVILSPQSYNLVGPMVL